MRKKLLVAIAAAATGALLVVASPVSAVAKPQVFNLLDVSGPDRNLGPGTGFGENGPPTLGARSAFTDVLYRWAGRKAGARVGRIEGLCTFTDVDLAARSVTAFCEATIFLPAGRLIGATHIRFAENTNVFYVPILGGTGAYANARGFVKITDIGPEDSGKSNDEFHIMP